MIMNYICKFVFSRKLKQISKLFNVPKRKIDYLLSVCLVGAIEALQVGMSTKTPKVTKHKPKVII